VSACEGEKRQEKARKDKKEKSKKDEGKGGEGERRTFMLISTNVH